jgi:hypothetical protein
MRKVLVSIALATAVVAAAPAAAQGYGGYGQNYGYPGDRGLVRQFDQRIGQLRNRIERLGERRAITGNEYRALRNHSAELRQRLFRFAQNGLSRGEAEDIADRIDNLRDRIRDERMDGRRYRDPRDGYWEDRRGW